MLYGNNTTVRCQSVTSMAVFVTWQSCDMMAICDANKPSEYLVRKEVFLEIERVNYVAARSYSTGNCV